MHDPAGRTPGTNSVLLAALSAAARRYRLPALPADCAAARSHGAATVLAFAIEAARIAKQCKVPASACARTLFTCALAALIRQAMASEGGDAAFQAQVLQATDAAVAEHVLLSGQLAADRRRVQGAIDAIAHPGKTRSIPAGPLHDALTRLHRLSKEGAWIELQQVAADARKLPDLNGHLRAELEAMGSHASLARLVRAAALLREGSVRHYLELCERRGPPAGSKEAATQGQLGARRGEAAEQATLQAFGKLADLLNARDPGAGRCRVARSLRFPPGFPGEADRAKDEWDAAIVRDARTGGGAEILLLAEVKASAAAATADLSRLLRGLHRLAHAASGVGYVFASADGPVRLAGESLRRLRPDGDQLPPTVIYCCSAPAETRPQLLSPASRSVLLAEPASLDFAGRAARGEAPGHDALGPVWDALTTMSRLRPVLEQYETMRVTREAMLHPQDLLVAAAQPLGSIPEP